MVALLVLDHIIHAFLRVVSCTTKHLIGSKSVNKTFQSFTYFDSKTEVYKLVIVAYHICQHGLS
jgi:hypothetical protein